MPYLYLAMLFLAKVFDNMLGTAKTILVQRGKPVLAGTALALSNYIYLHITKNVVTDDNGIALIIVSIASGVGCYIAIKVNNRLSKDRTYVNVIMSDNKVAMQDFRDFLAQHHITNVASDSYTRDWDTKTITITAYANTKAESSLISSYIKSNDTKFKRIVQKL